MVNINRRFIFMKFKRIRDLREDSDKYQKEIAELLEISINTVKVLKSRALQKLRDFFARPDL